MTDSTQYVTPEKYADFETEMQNLRGTKIPSIAKRIDDARQMGDLSENAEYHQAREDMAWTQSRVKELQYLLTNAQVIKTGKTSALIQIGSVITVNMNGKDRVYTIVGQQESDPAGGKISNASPLGEAFIGRKKGDKVIVKTPAGQNTYEIISVS